MKVVYLTYQNPPETVREALQDALNVVNFLAVFEESTCIENLSLSAFWTKSKRLGVRLAFDGFISFRALRKAWQHGFVIVPGHREK